MIFQGERATVKGFSRGATFTFVKKERVSITLRTAGLEDCRSAF